ncbi:MAG: tRNA (adenosine(37)-N6)-threonylcarbamoyltransferase complex ATPase subunit type 1 TsaE [bacterium]
MSIKHIEILTLNYRQTQSAGKVLAEEILETSGQKSFVLGLEGELGGGKTTFLQGFAQGLGIKEKITSPTFVIMKRFKIKNLKFKNFYHFDCYRIQKAEEISVTGLKEIISDPQNIVAIEWSERIKKIMPKNALRLSFVYMGKDKRKIVIE